MPKKWKTRTELCHDEELYHRHHGSIVPPIYQNSLYAFKSVDDINKAFESPADSTIYSRGNNVTVNMVEAKLAAISNAESARLFSSGMAAIAAAIMHCIADGDHIIAVDNIYGPANNFISQYLQKKFEIELDFVDGTETKNIEDALKPNTSLIYLESPNSLVFRLQNLKEIATLAQEHEIWTIIDNTWATPIFQKPLDFGIDIEVHSVSKYLCGHSDIVAGLILGQKDILDSIMLREQAWFGASMSPFESWLLMRSLRTLDLRMRNHQRSAFQIARFLDGHPKVNRVYYPGLESHPQYDLGRSQMTGYSGLLSFDLYTNSLDEVIQFVDSLELFKIGVSWGGHESLVYIPSISYLKELGEEKFSALGISKGLIRISVGLEDSEDLIYDLRDSLEEL